MSDDATISAWDVLRQQGEVLKAFQDRALRAEDQLEQLMAIVAEFADSDPHHDEYGWSCMWCSRDIDRGEHSPGCLWRRAHELLYEPVAQE